MFGWTLLWSGSNLSVVTEATATIRRFSQEHEHKTSLYYTIIFESSIASLICDEEEASITEQLKRNVMENKNPYQLVVLYFYKMFLFLVLNEYDDMKHSAEKFFEFSMPSWQLLSGHAVHAYIGGLASFRIFRETSDPLWAQRGAQLKARMHTWKDQGSSWNFESKSFLLEAEEFFSNGNVERAQVLYENAISSAREHKFLHEEALAYEKAANFYLSIANKSMALKYFTGAHETYLKWGAYAKATTLYAYIHEKCACEVPLTSVNVEVGSNGLHISSMVTDTPKRRHSC